MDYRKWDHVGSDDSDDDQAKNSPDVLRVARSRKLEADAILDAVNNRGLSEGTSREFAKARSLYEGALAALKKLGPPGSDSEKSEARQLQLACHLNICAAAVQEREWTVALEHCEHSLAIEPSHAKALEASVLSIRC